MKMMYRGEASPTFGIEPAGNFRPPEMQSADVSHDRATDHDVVEVSDHEVGVVYMNVDAKAARNKPVRPPTVNRPMKPKA